LEGIAHPLAVIDLLKDMVGFAKRINRCSKRPSEVRCMLFGEYQKSIMKRRLNLERNTIFQSQTEKISGCIIKNSTFISYMI